MERCTAAPPFLCLYDLLPTKELVDARAVIASRRVKLQNAAIGDHALVDFDVRAAHSAGAGSALRALLLPRIFAAMSSENVLERLGLGPISRERVDVQLVCYPAGGKYRPHRDECGGDINGLRLLGHEL
jgi:hypothetical protein